jgi:hypothetical protein
LHARSVHPSLSLLFQANSIPAFAAEQQHPYNVPFLSSSNLINTVDVDDDSSSDEEYSHDSPLHPQAAWSPTLNKRYASKVIRGESRLWAIPYRFGKRGAMPYRFGKRAGMHFRLGKKSASL